MEFMIWVGLPYNKFMTVEEAIKVEGVSNIPQMLVIGNDISLGISSNDGGRPTMKIVCSDCRHFRRGQHMSPLCMSNPTTTWLGDKFADASEKNANNDCPEFQKRTLIQRILLPKEL